MKISWAAFLKCGRKPKRCEVIFDVAKRKATLNELEAQTAMQGFWDDPNKAKTHLGRVNELKAVLDPFARIEKLVEEAGLMIELSEAEEPGPQRDHAISDAGRDLDQAEGLFEKLETQSLLSGPLDRSNAFVTVHAGAGGTESCDWANMLFRMFQRFASKKGFDVEVLDIQAGDEAGIKYATFAVRGSYAYGFMKCERGIHRLVRISPFDSNKRRHTSFASLDVIAELDEDIEVEIDEKDMRIDTFRSSGSGGQHVNKTDSAIRITHIPTGIVVSCQAERSQHMNKAKSLQMLKAKLYELEMDKKRKEMERFYGQKGEIAWGSQIRSYVFQPYTMVKDHRTDAETSNVEAVMDGDLDRFIEAYLKREKALEKKG
jgi:peptide chain release factor 2